MTTSAPEVTATLTPIPTRDIPCELTSGLLTPWLDLPVPFTRRDCTKLAVALLVTNCRRDGSEQIHICGYCLRALRLGDLMLCHKCKRPAIWTDLT